MPLLPPARAPMVRQAAVARVTDQGEDTYLTRYGRARAEPRWVQEQSGWETSARAYAQYNGPAAFNALVISDMCARCDLRIEQRDENGDWNPTDDPRLVRALDEYINHWQDTRDLVRAHAWRYNVDGHAFMCFWDGEYGVEYGVFSSTRVELHRPAQESATVKLLREGRPEEGTAFVVPIEQVFHVWIPDNEELLRPTSPMKSSIEDLHRYRALTRYAWRTAESRLAMEGLLWVPSDIERDDAPPLAPDDEQGMDADVGTPRTPFEQKYYELAKLSFENNDDITAIAPPYISWDKELGAPEWVKVGQGLDEQGLAHRREAIEDAARPWPVPTTALMGGGVGDANHWSEWLASDKFVESGVAPNMDRICHMDLTRVFLYRRLQFEGYAPEAIRNLRVGYDTAPIVVKRDQSDLALKALALGAIGYETAREAMDWTEDDAPTPEDIDTLVAILSKTAPDDGSAPAPGASGLPAGPSNVTQAPPEQPTAPSSNGNGAAPSPVAVAAVLSAMLASVGADDD